MNIGRKTHIDKHIPQVFMWEGMTDQRNDRNEQQLKSFSIKTFLKPKPISKIRFG